MTPYRQNPWDIPAEEFRRSFEVNVMSLARISHRLVPPMLARKWGRVINVTSGTLELPQPPCSAVSRAAVDKLVRDFVPQLAGTGVQMNLLDLRTDLGGPKAPNDPPLGDARGPGAGSSRGW
jgi:NAD(P)-dependent dehydrogenase (short-subunit alcohol dehydrogenase family)